MASLTLIFTWSVELRIDFVKISVKETTHMGFHLHTQHQCCRKTLMVHQTFVRWASYILFKFVKSLIRHLDLAIGNVRCVWWFSWTLQHPTPFESHLRWLTQIWLFKEFSWNIIRMEILIYRRQRVDYAEQDDVTCYVAGPLEICPQRISMEWSRAASPGAVLQRAMSPYMVALGPDELR